MKNSQPIGVCALLLNNKGQVLLGKRKNSYKAGYYGLPGGRIELNEHIIAAIKREVEEETSLQINNFEYLGVVRENQGDYDFIHFVYVARNVKQQPRLCEPEKCEGWEWFNLDRIDSLVLPGHRAAIKIFNESAPIADIIPQLS